MKTLVLCFDGTGNEFRRKGNTNVVRILEGVRRSAGKVVTFYDPGVGTFSDPAASSSVRKRWTLLLGLAFGFGIKQNIKDGYRFLIKYWEPSAQIYLFGFSRGAYTARALAGLLEMCGLLDQSKENLIDYAVRIHWKRRPDFNLARKFKNEFSRDVPITFLGAFDTVKTVGLWDALLQGTGKLFRRVRVSLPYTAALPNVEAGRHAISSDEKRSRFRPNQWFLRDDHPSPDNFEQVWFAGVHADIGGGYSDDRGLGDITLAWMIAGAASHGLVINDSARPNLTAANPTAKKHNNLIPFWWLLGWRKRRIPDGSSIHITVKTRTSQLKTYRPPLPDNLNWVS